MDSPSTTSPHEGNHWRLQSQSQPAASAKTLISSNLPLIWMACLIKLSTRETLLLHRPLQCPDTFAFFKIIVFNPPPPPLPSALWLQQQRNTENLKLFTSPAKTSSDLLICFTCHRPILRSPLQQGGQWTLIRALQLTQLRVRGAALSLSLWGYLLCDEES